MEYKDQLKDHRWRAKRKEIIRRDGQKCIMCGCHDNLNVHHVFYYKGDYMAWDCPDDLLITLCQQCHEDEHNMGRVSSEVYQIMRDSLYMGECLNSYRRRINTEKRNKLNNKNYGTFGS